MAELSDQQLDQRTAEFDQLQMRSVDSLHAADADNVDADALRSVDLITDEVRARIGTVDHTLNFRRALQQNRQAGMNSLEAFRASVLSTWGRYILGNRNNTLETAGSAFRDGISQMMGFRFDPSGFEGRDELLLAEGVVDRHLAALPPADRAARLVAIMDSARRTTTTPAGVKTLKRQNDDAVGVQKKMTEAYGYFSSNSRISEFLDSRSSFETVLGSMPAPSTPPASFREMRLTANRDLKAAEKQLNGLDAPEGTKLATLLASKVKNHPRGGAPFDETAYRVELEREYQTKLTTYKAAANDAERRSLALDKIFEQSKLLHAQMKTLVDNMEKAHQVGIVFGAAPLDDVPNLVTLFKAFEIDSDSFDPAAFNTYAGGLFDFFHVPANVSALQASFDTASAASDANVKTSKTALDQANQSVESKENLSDGGISVNIIAAVLEHDFPTLDLPQRLQLAGRYHREKLKLMETTKGYEALARDGSPELLNVMNNAGFRYRLLLFTTEKDGKAEPVFKGFKPSDFASVARIRELFDSGKLNYENGFYALAAFERMEGPRVRSMQARELERGLLSATEKHLFAKAKEKDSSVNLTALQGSTSFIKRVQLVFDRRLGEKREPINAHFASLSDADVGQLLTSKQAELQLRVKALKHKKRLRQVDPRTFRREYREIVSESEDYGLNFNQASTASEYWNSPEAQWLRDLGVNTGKYLGGKAGRIAMTGLKLYGHYTLGALKLSGRLGLQAMALPFRASKYPLKLAANVGTKPFRMTNNFFRRSKWSAPFKVSDDVKKDWERVKGYGGKVATETATGAGKVLAEVPKAEWNKTEFKNEKFKDRTNVDMTELEKEIARLKELGTVKPVQVANSDTDLTQDIDAILVIDKQLKSLGAKGAASSTPPPASAAAA